MTGVFSVAGFFVCKIVMSCNLLKRALLKKFSWEFCSLRMDSPPSICKRSFICHLWVLFELRMNITITLHQGSPTFLNQRATTWVLSHTTRATTLFTIFSHNKFSQFAFCCIVLLMILLWVNTLVILIVSHSHFAQKQCYISWRHFWIKHSFETFTWTSLDSIERIATE